MYLCSNRDRRIQYKLHGLKARIYWSGPQREIEQMRVAHHEKCYNHISNGATSILNRTNEPSCWHVLESKVAQTDRLLPYTEGIVSFKGSRLWECAYHRHSRVDILPGILSYSNSIIVFLFPFFSDFFCSQCDLCNRSYSRLPSTRESELCFVVSLQSHALSFVASQQHFLHSVKFANVT